MDRAPAYGHIVVGVDGSPLSRQALHWAAREAALRGCPLDVVYGWQVSTEPRPPGEWGGVAPPLDAFQEQAERKLRDIIAEEFPDGLPCEVAVHAMHKPPGRALLSFCGSADMLVIGSRPHGRLAAWLVGSVSDDTLRNASCTVVVVRRSVPEPTGD
ncbi:MAG: universal stress protein [Mycobacteriales bacterium]